VIPNGELRRRFQAAARDLVPQPNALGYVACRAAYQRSEAGCAALIEHLRGNRDLPESFFSRHLSQFGVAQVQATYLAWIDPRWLGERGERVSALLRASA
jgi:bifunctional pyridoxal-dependent enzyme with beta-cystathionase and maltose regulon repressor activities